MEIKIVGVLLVFLYLFIVTGCASQQHATKQNENVEIHSDGPALLVIDGREYIDFGHLEVNEFTIDQLLGTVQEKVPLGITPTTNLSSNFFEVGTEIYSVKEVEHVFLVKVGEETFKVFGGK